MFCVTYSSIQIPHANLFCIFVNRPIENEKTTGIKCKQILPPLNVGCDVKHFRIGRINVKYDKRSHFTLSWMLCPSTKFHNFRFTDFLAEIAGQRQKATQTNAHEHAYAQLMRNSIITVTVLLCAVNITVKRHKQTSIITAARFAKWNLQDLVTRKRYYYCRRPYSRKKSSRSSYTDNQVSHWQNDSKFKKLWKQQSTDCKKETKVKTVIAKYCKSKKEQHRANNFCTKKGWGS